MYKNILSKIFFVSILFHWMLPNMRAIDNIGSQWFYLSLINLIVLIYNLFFNNKELNFLHFNKFLLAPIILLIWGFTGLFNAVNTSEVIIESSRYFNVITSFFNLYLLIRSHLSIKFILSTLMVFLAYEVIAMLPEIINNFKINGYIDRNAIGSGIASNINITTYSILIKIPFLFYCFIESKAKIQKYFFWILSLFSFLVISIISTRSAILCIIFISTATIIILLNKRNRLLFKKFMVLIIIPLIISTAINSLTQINNKSQSTVQRLTSLANQNDKSTSNRLTYYKEAVKEFFEEPIFGVGIGNFKIHSIRVILDSERYYLAPYNTHNDFLQVLAELSIFGLILYIILVYYGALKLIINKKFDLLHTSILASLFIYTFDAIFNFPHARPIIQVVFALILALIYRSIEEFDKDNKAVNFKGILIAFLLISIGSVYINKRVFNSLIEQQIFQYDMSKGVYNRDPEIIKTFEEDFPNLNAASLPIKAIKANYFSISEPELALKKLDLAIKDNPVIMFPQVLKSLIYMKQLKIDSAYYYSRMAFDKGPTIETHAMNFLNLVGFLKKKEDLDYILSKLKNSKSITIWKKYLNTVYEIKKEGISDKDKATLESLAKKFPNDIFIKSLNFSKNLTLEQLKQVDSLDKRASDLIENKQYKQAIDLYQKASLINQGEKSYLINIVSSYFKIGDYENCKIYLQRLKDEFTLDDGFVEYYLGSIEVKEGSGSGCDNFFISFDKGFKRGEIMYKNFCLNKS